MNNTRTLVLCQGCGDVNFRVQKPKDEILNGVMNQPKVREEAGMGWEQGVDRGKYPIEEYF